jgi:hypothetical protein
MRAVHLTSFPNMCQDVPEFSLEPTSGEIRSRDRIDRESLGVEGRFDLVVISSTPTYPIEVRKDLALSKIRYGSRGLDPDSDLKITWIRIRSCPKQKCFS